jgi:hypothetical protein
MQLSSEETLTLQLRRRSFQLALADLRVQGALIVTTPWFAVCPCCGYPTLPSLHDYNFCRLCGWLDDGQDDPDSDRLGFVNQDYSLTEARRNFIDGHTMYRTTDEQYVVETQAAGERDLLIAAYDALLPDVHPWSFIGALKHIDALGEALRERKLGRRKARLQRDAGEDERRRADHDWEVWRNLAAGTLWRAQDWAPPSVLDGLSRTFERIASRATTLLEGQLECNAPFVAHRSSAFRCWCLGDRSAWLLHYVTETKVGLLFSPSDEDTNDQTFPVDDGRTPEAIARRLAEFFGKPTAPV